MPEAIRQGDIPGVQLRCRQRLPLPVEAAWSWLTEPALLGRWLAREVQVETGPEGTVHLTHISEAGDEVRERGRSLEVEPPRRWRLAFEQLDSGWPVPTRLTLELSPVEGGCELSVLQEGFEHLPLSDCLTIWETYRDRWRTALARLAAACTD